jgi:ArsR family transcriptional regulator
VAESKKNAFPVHTIRLADLARALAHPARIAILEVLADRASCMCGEIVDELPLAQATVSQHLKALKEAGLVEGMIDGPRVCYCLNQTTLAELGSDVATLVERLTAGECC